MNIVRCREPPKGAQKRKTAVLRVKLQTYCDDDDEMMMIVRMTVPT